MVKKSKSQKRLGNDLREFSKFYCLSVEKLVAGCKLLLASSSNVQFLNSFCDVSVGGYITAGKVSVRHCLDIYKQYIQKNRHIKK